MLSGRRALPFLRGVCTSTHVVILPSGHEREINFSPNSKFLWQPQSRNCLMCR